MYVRLAFAVAVHVDPDLLLVDEVLAVGDEPFQRKCMDKIRSFQEEGRTIVLVSHSADQVADLCDRAVLLKHGVMQYDGSPREAIRELRAGFEQDRREEESAAPAPARPQPRGASRGRGSRPPPASRSATIGRPVTPWSPASPWTWTTPSTGGWSGFAIETPAGSARLPHEHPHGGRRAQDRRAAATRSSSTSRRCTSARATTSSGSGVGEVVGEMIDLQPQAATFNVNSSDGGQRHRSPSTPPSTSCPDLPVARDVDAEPSRETFVRRISVLGAAAALLLCGCSDAAEPADESAAATAADTPLALPPAPSSAAPSSSAPSSTPSAPAEPNERGNVVQVTGQQAGHRRAPTDDRRSSSPSTPWSWTSRARTSGRLRRTGTTWVCRCA